MKFQPKTEKEIDVSRLLPEGQYSFEVMKAEEKLSSKGNDMIVLSLRVFKEDGTFITVTDYLMEAIAYKLRHAADACGLIHEYEGGILSSEGFVGKTGELKLKIQQDKEGKYPDKNVVSDYIKSDKSKPETKKQPTDDEIPF